MGCCIAGWTAESGSMSPFGVIEPSHTGLNNLRFQEVGDVGLRIHNPSLEFLGFYGYKCVSINISETDSIFQNSLCKTVNVTFKGYPNFTIM